MDNEELKFISLKSVYNEDTMISITNSIRIENVNVNGDIIKTFPELYEENSYHELRCISNDYIQDDDLSMDYDDYDEEDDDDEDFEDDTYDSYSKFYGTFTDNYFDETLETTDDQLFIKIVKEDVGLKTDNEKETSIFDSITFNIEDDDESMPQIKLKEIEKCPILDEPKKLVFFKKPEIKIPKRTRKPLDLANYRNLITQAINSSPEKCMILTEIYKWIMDNVPYFKEKEDRGRTEWRNSIRHTLSVNERFIRIKNRKNYRSSYWTVCEDGDLSTKFASFPWINEIYKPEERKRKYKKKRKTNNIKDKIIQPIIKRGRGRPRKNLDVTKPQLKLIKSVKRKYRKKKKTTTIKNVKKYEIKVQINTRRRGRKKKATTKNIIENNNDTVNNNKRKYKKKIYNEPLRRSNRKSIRKTWIL